MVVHSGSLVNPNPFHVISGNGKPMHLQHNGTNSFVKKNGGFPREWISTDKGWGPDAEVDKLPHSLFYRLADRRRSELQALLP